MSGGVFRIVNKKIGEGGAKQGVEVKRLQQLLYMAGFTRVGAPDGKWGTNTTLAWQEYQDTYGHWPTRSFVEGGDPENRLFYLALSARVLIPLPSGELGSKGLKSHYGAVRDLKIPYGWKDHGNGTMMTWGLALNGNVSWAICTKPGGRLTTEFDMKVPRASNCTAFANVLMSIWDSGNLHNANYSASQAAGGADPGMNLSKRYGYAPLRGSPKPPLGVAARPGLYTSLDDLNADIQPGRLYHFAICKPDGFVTHDTVLLDGEIYECNLDKTPACYRSSLDDRWARIRHAKKYAIVSGRN